MMLKTVMIGVMLLGTLSCVSIKRVMMYEVSLEYQEAGVATVNLDPTEDVDLVGEWTYEPDFLTLDQIPNNLRCVSSETWHEKLKPKLKAASRTLQNQDD